MSDVQREWRLSAMNERREEAVGQNETQTACTEVSCVCTRVCACAWRCLEG
jgi:hypothetical protein